jgi:4-amino-4-deoxy-L-arabinose transferase-like glycosyltransferase
MWFKQHWTVNGNDSGRYLLDGSQLISGQALENLSSISEFNGGHGPVLPTLVGTLILLFGRDTAEIAWAARLLALLNPLLAYFLVKRISSPTAGLIAAALVTLFGFNVDTKLVVNIDSLVLTFYLLSLLTLLAAIERNRSVLALLSGVLLGVSILTKETAVVNVPLALLAVLLLDWEVPKALWHYLGAVLVCLSWWAWVYTATGEVYLVDSLPIELQYALIVATAVVLVVAAGAYSFGLMARFLSGKRRRRWTGWFVVFAWTVCLSGMLLATGAHALGKLSFHSLSQYLANLLAPSTVVVPTLLIVLGYAIWKALRHHGAWTLLALALLFQMPVCLLIVVQFWAPRQFLIPQTLVFCVLAALIVDAGTAALQERGYTRQLISAAIAGPLAILLLVAYVEKVQALLPQDLVGEVVKQHRVAPQATQMSDWVDENVPKGEHILIVAEPVINVGQANYLMFLDGGRHEWTRLRLDQGICHPRPNVQMGCDPAQNDVSRIPSDAIWVQKLVNDRCRVISLSMSDLLKQSRQSDSDYVLIAGSNLFPWILELPAPLQASGAFEVVHAEPPRTARVVAPQGVVLLKSTGRAPKTVPARVNAITALALKRCE